MLQPGSEWPVVIDPDERRIELDGLVIRCERVPVSQDAERVYGLGIMFVESSGPAMTGLADLCGGRFVVEELPYRILVVGLEPLAARLTARTLKDLGYEVHAVADPREALAAAKEARADALIVGLQREPSLWWVLEAFVTDPDTAPAPLIAITELTGLTADRRQYLTDRRVHVVAQPLRSEDLAATVRNALRGPAR